MLITLLLCEHNILKEPMLYLSLHFKTHRRYYYELLNEVRLSGDWEAWLSFFAEAVKETANQATKTTQTLISMINNDRERVAKLGRAADSALKIYNLFLESAIASPMWLAKQSGLSPATVNKTLQHLVDLKILNEITSQKRNRVFSYKQYIETLNQGTEPP